MMNISKASKMSSQIISNILVVGGGLTSAVTTSLLADAKPPSTQLTIWDKARGAGGRMSTARSPSNPNCQVDLGAQYVTATPHYQKLHKDYYDQLMAKGLLATLSSSISGNRSSQPGSIDYVMTAGSSSIVKHFFASSGIPVQFGHFIETINLTEDKKWSVKTKDGQNGVFDCVVLTMPTPQILQVAGDVLKDKPDLKHNLEEVKYSSRYGLALFYNDDQSDKIRLKENASAEYISDDDIFRFVSIDNYKRSGKASGSATSVVLHTSVPFGVERVEKTVEEVGPELMTRFQTRYPDWPTPDSMKCQKWRYSQVTHSYPGQPGYLVLHEDPLLIAAGDAFVHSHVDGCIESATKTANIIKSKLSA